MSIQIRIKEEELLTKGLRICENCKFCIKSNGFPHCSLKDKNVGLIESCVNFKVEDKKKIIEKEG